MKTTSKMILTVLAASLILVTGCYNSDFVEPPIPGYDGIVAAGWTAFDNGDYDAAMVCFQDAIDMDVSRPEAFLGATWCSVLLPDYWSVCFDYSAMALNLDGGVWPIETVTAEKYQDINWTEFECTHPQLTDTDMLVIESWGTTDTLIVVVEEDTIVVFEPDTSKLAMDNVEIGEYLEDLYYDDLVDLYGSSRFQYKFEINDPNVFAMYTVANGFSLIDANVDSIVNNTSTSDVYISMRLKKVEIADADDIYTWIMYNNRMTYTYATYTPMGGQSSIPLDACTAYGILQDARAENGQGIQGSAMLLGIASEGDYSFSHYAHVTSLRLKGMAAAIAYRNKAYRFALSICRDNGFGLDLLTNTPGFLILLAQEIEAMLL